MPYNRTGTLIQSTINGVVPDKPDACKLQYSSGTLNYDKFMNRFCIIEVQLNSDPLQETRVEQPAIAGAGLLQRDQGDQDRR